VSIVDENNTIIASQDKSLGLPGIPQSALEYYVKMNGKVDYFEVEMEEYCRWCGKLSSEILSEQTCQHISTEKRYKLSDSGEVVVVLPKVEPIQDDIYNLIQVLTDPMEEAALEFWRQYYPKVNSGIIVSAFEAGSQYQEQKEVRKEPTQEEIESAANKIITNMYGYRAANAVRDFIAGIKWYKQQLQSK